MTVNYVLDGTLPAPDKVEMTTGSVYSDPKLQWYYSDELRAKINFVIKQAEDILKFNDVEIQEETKNQTPGND